MTQAATQSSSNSGERQRLDSLNCRANVRNENPNGSFALRLTNS